MHVLECEHEYKGQSRCGLCDRCWNCCVCGARRDSEERRAGRQERPAVASRAVAKLCLAKPEEGTAVIVDRRSAVGRARLVVLCCCGTESQFFEWSWAGHGKARCSGCRKWIYRAGLRVGE